jgi:hypothetical protein
MASKYKVLNFMTSSEPPTAKINASARQAFRARLDARLPNDIEKASAKLRAARDAKVAACDRYNKLRDGLSAQDPKRTTMSAEEKDLHEIVLERDIEISEARRELRIARERFAPDLRRIVMKEVTTLAPNLLEASKQFELAIEMLSEADAFCLGQGIDPVGYGGLAMQVAGLQELARQLRGGK